MFKKIKEIKKNVTEKVDDVTKALEDTKEILNKSDKLLKYVLVGGVVMLGFNLIASGATIYVCYKFSKVLPR